MDLFDLKNTEQQNGNFRPKPWTKPLAENENFATFKFDILIV